MSGPYSGLCSAPGQLSARAKKKARQSANRQSALQNGGAGLALQNGGFGDGTDGGVPRLQVPPTQFAGGTKGGGKGGRDTHNGVAIR